MELTETLQDEVLATASGLLGRVDHAISATLQLLCPSAVQSLAARLRPGVHDGECHDSFVLAAALYLLFLYDTLDGEDLRSFDAGTLALTFAGREERLPELAARLIAPWCEDGAAFLGVRA